VITNFYWLNSGYTTALDRISRKSGSWKIIQFDANVGLLIHSQKGPILFDTGYTAAYNSASKKWPDLLYPLIMPMYQKQEQPIAKQLKNHGIQPTDIEHVFISHLHADHIAGLQDFPNATFYIHEIAYNFLHSIQGFKAVKNGILKGLIPEDFENRVTIIKDENAVQHSILGNKWDLFGDGSIEVYWLPGHARGQTGIQFKVNNDLIFLIADAAWHLEGITNKTLPSNFAKIIMDSMEDFKATVNKLHEYSKVEPKCIIAPTHCPVASETLKKMGYAI
jgi:glyoxylase-like metal-dependent hydrolase (beta-lactamase superfamily II)